MPKPRDNWEAIGKAGEADSLYLSSEFVKYFGSLKGKNIGKFGFYPSFCSISAM